MDVKHIAKKNGFRFQIMRERDVGNDVLANDMDQWGQVCVDGTDMLIGNLRKAFVKEKVINGWSKTHAGGHHVTHHGVITVDMDKDRQETLRKHMKKRKVMPLIDPERPSDGDANARQFVCIDFHSGWGKNAWSRTMISQQCGFVCIQANFDGTENDPLARAIDDRQAAHSRSHRSSRNGDGTNDYHPKKVKHAETIQAKNADGQPLWIDNHNLVDGQPGETTDAKDPEGRNRLPKMIPNPDAYDEEPDRTKERGMLRMVKHDQFVWLDTSHHHQRQEDVSNLRCTTPDEEDHNKKSYVDLNLGQMMQWNTSADGVWNDKVMTEARDGHVRIDPKMLYRHLATVDWSRHVFAVMLEEVGRNGPLIRAIVPSFLRHHVMMSEGMLDYDPFNAAVINSMQYITGSVWFCCVSKFTYGQGQCDEYYAMNIEFLHIVLMRPKVPTHGVMIDDGRTAVMTFEDGRMVDIGLFDIDPGPEPALMEEDDSHRLPAQPQAQADVSTAQCSADGASPPVLLLTTVGAPVVVLDAVPEGNRDDQ